MSYVRPSILHYRFAQAVSRIVSAVVFRRKFLRNEIKGKKGAFVVIANHQSQLDFVNIIGASSRPMTFVISNSFFSTLPIRGYLEKMGVIPKQQFQTTMKDLKKIKAVIEQGEPVVIYPAGLMCEDGLSTPIPPATYKFLQWLETDVYVARTSGTYFVMPKWGKGLRPGRTYMDIYRLFTKEELAGACQETIRQKTDEALLFDAYREQEQLHVSYRNGGNIEGLENVLYLCPHCGEEFAMTVENGDAIRCGKCGYEQKSDPCGFLRNEKGIGREIRYVSDWSRMIYEDLKGKILAGSEGELSDTAEFRMIDPDRRKFLPVGRGRVSLSKDGFLLEGSIRGEERSLRIPIASIPSLPFSPGRYFEIQHGSDIYRCVPENGKLVMKFINLVKILYELNHPKG
ncbi:MAG: 1-acyl-sn-glycerol-3-phosphate acyltransferase [Oscillospiraceae bacterium]|nr:1-acyl-sn-glycerol-3-phosphate acyltransferase [Oscillospiraceae bacterium]